GKFDYLYDKVGLYDTLRAIVSGYRSARCITGCWQSINDIQDRMLNFLENHDEQRIASDFFAGDPWKALPALVVSATMNRNPFMIYFGQELGEPGMDAEGFSGRDGRTTIFDYWSVASIRRWRNDGTFTPILLTDSEKQLSQYYTNLLRLCNQSAAIRQGAFFDLMYVNLENPSFNPDKQYAYLRSYEKECLLIAVNFDAQAVDLSVFIPGHAFDCLGITEIKDSSAVDLLSNIRQPASLQRDTYYPVHLPAYGSVIIRFR
ncbi:MAG: alpha-glucosidase C-terminal domain-containing protein, partial [Dysgonamonadaceae bacterium]|nr:alpha-glucosidase C-terminal domain-containing protein [Dysgonamonadaceae bacterium]